MTTSAAGSTGTAPSAPGPSRTSRRCWYDNAQLVELYSEAYALDPRPEYKRVVAETLGFVTREMTAPEGGFYSALDADSNDNGGRVLRLDRRRDREGARQRGRHPHS